MRGIVCSFGEAGGIARGSEEVYWSGLEDVKADGEFLESGRKVVRN